MDRAAETPPHRLARFTGLFYLLTIVGGGVAQGLVSTRLVHYYDASATAANIRAHEELFGAGFGIYLLEMACNVVMTALFYRLLKPAGRHVSLAAAYLGLVGCTVKTFTRVFYVLPLFLLGGERFLGVFSKEQLEALALLSLQVNEQGAGIAMAFFGLYALLKGYLILRSRFLPGFLGVLSIAAGLGWLTFLTPTLGYRLFGVIAPLGLVGAVAQIGWLLIKGVDDQRWTEQAAQRR